jgi:hypothetical protein
VDPVAVRLNVPLGVDGGEAPPRSLDLGLYHDNSNVSVTEGRLTLDVSGLAGVADIRRSGPGSSLKTQPALPCTANSPSERSAPANASADITESGETKANHDARGG